MTTDPQPIIEEVHRVYCALSGQSPNFKVWERRFYDFCQAGYGPADMEQVMIWLMRENRKNDYKRSISLLKLMDLEFFDAYLCTARAENRNNKPKSPATKVPESFRGHSQDGERVVIRSVGQIINGMTKV